MSAARRPPELLAPAGDWECVRAAAANGADAIYFGLTKFNARLRAENFTEEDLPRLMDYLHARGMRGYIAFNTLIFEEELPAAEEQLRLLQAARVDAAIIQDLGLAAWAPQIAPDVEVHASTQMTLTSPEGLRFARRLGIGRTVLARELSLRELAKFNDPALPETEVFVHGALCVAYSGQCLTSEALGQRSANRGECAQACRLPYQLVVDGAVRELGDRRYLLSPQDLAAVREIPELVRLGVASFKIEGRLKSPEYVAAVCQVYRRAIDAAVAAQPAPVTPKEQYQLEMTFSRGLFSGWMHGVNHQQLVHARFGKKRGAYLGRIAEVGRDAVTLESRPDFPIRPGDGIVFDTGGDTEREQGGRVYEVRGAELRFQRGKLDPARLRQGDRVWKTSDPQLDAELQRTFAKDPPVRRQPLAMHVFGRPGAPLVVEARGQRVESALPLQPAVKRPLDAASLREQLGRLGDTRFELTELTLDLPEPVMLPLSELNRLRRTLVAQLEGAASPLTESSAPLLTPLAGRPHSESADHPQPLRSFAPSVPGSSAPPLPLFAGAPHSESADYFCRSAAPQLSVLCRTLEQVTVALEAGVERILADFEDIRRYKEAVALVRTAASGARIFLATPRIQKAGEQGFFKLIENAAPDGVLIRNLGAIDHFRGSPLERIGDFSLNVANSRTAALLLGEELSYLTASYDLNAQQLLALLRAVPAGSLEIVLHQHMPMFHMEHCVFAAFLSEGTDHTNCGRPCDRHAVALRDRVGLEHPLKADVGCRNTVFHAKAQTGAEFLAAFREAGARRFRVELLNEPPADAARIVRTYQSLLAGHLRPMEVAASLRAVSQLGVTNGTLTVL
ncbi:MAG: U32 family peptidase [Verrucomicrobia bacterium]|nr:U32 family peptidase [Verrucomicrobiota bacterium]